MHSTDLEDRNDFITGLRALADFLDAHPGMPVPHYGTEILVSAREVEDGGTAQVEYAARQLDTAPRKQNGVVETKRIFGSVTYRVMALSCEVMFDFTTDHRCPDCGSTSIEAFKLITDDYAGPAFCCRACLKIWARPAMTRREPKDYYAILGITRDATARQVKSAYRKLARLHHPDANPGDPEATARFQIINEAYETLADPARRAAYDKTYRPSPGSGITTPGETPAASRLLSVLEDTWTIIRRYHGEIPPVVLIIASGTGTKQARWGHHAPGRWHHYDTEHAEVMISGEGLRRTPPEVLGTLLHEAAHALAAARGIGDTSRQGRYHNRKYAALATELGLDVKEDTQLGWTITSVPAATAQRYEAQLTALAEAMTFWREGEHIPGTKKRDTNLIAASCPCGRKIRVAASTLKEANITCEACTGNFQPDSAPDA